MQYRKFGRLDWKVSALGFGTMRLPIIGKDMNNIDEAQTIQMIRYAIDHGINYVDSAYVYHGGNSERIVGRALQDGYRSKIRLATKMPSFIIESPADFDRIFNEQLERLQTDKIDFYLIHALDKMLWSRMRDFKVLHWADKMLAKGKISYLGFSFHDETALLKEIINYYNNWTFCQIQYNYMDEKFQAGTKGLQYAAGKGLAVVIMEPIRGGQLSRPPESIKNLLNTGRRKSSPAEWALRWVWNHPEVSVVLSGMSNMQQVVENVESATKFGSDTLSQSEINRIKRARDSYKKLVPIPCTGCEYCMPCDNGVAIPQIFALYNEGVMYNDKKTQQAHYREGPMAIKDSQRPDNCKECKKCEEACPQKIPITEWLKKAKDYLEA